MFLLKDPGLVPNAPDGNSCLHACAQMIMKTKLGGRVYSFDEINTLLRRKPGQYSWWYAVLDKLGREGFEIKSIDTFSTERFVREGESYLLEYYGLEAGKVQIGKVDVSIIREDAKKFLENKSIEFDKRAATPDDIRNHIQAGWYIVPCINSKILNFEPGYSGHFVFVYGFDDQNIVFHDPGGFNGTAQAAQQASWELFENAWQQPREMVCFRPVSTCHPSVTGLNSHIA